MTTKNSSLLYFNGRDTYIQVPLDSPSNNGGPITIEFWNYVKREDRGRGVVFSFHTLNGSNIESSTEVRTACHAPWHETIYWDCGDINQGGRIWYSYENYFNKWTHIALVSGGGTSGGQQILYLDGKPVGSPQNSVGNSKTFKTLLIGCTYNNGATSNHQKGWMDGFRVWNVARTENEINTWMYKRCYNPAEIGPRKSLFKGSLVAALNLDVNNRYPAGGQNSSNNVNVYPRDNQNGTKWTLQNHASLSTPNNEMVELNNFAITPTQTGTRYSPDTSNMSQPGAPSPLSWASTATISLNTTSQAIAQVSAGNHLTISVLKISDDANWQHTGGPSKYGKEHLAGIGSSSIIASNPAPEVQGMAFFATIRDADTNKVVKTFVIGERWDGQVNHTGTLSVGFNDYKHHDNQGYIDVEWSIRS